MPEKNTTGRGTVGALLGLHALTSLHPGSGTALGAVDMPVQRERHTHWPTIAGSALKGVLRDAVREKIKEKAEHERDRKRADFDETVVAIFGPPNDDNNAAAGALSVTDARILAFPVRSFKGVFMWVTCAAVLERLQRDAELAGQDAKFVIAKPAADSGAIVAANSTFLMQDQQGQKLILEEFEFIKEEGGDNSSVADWLAGHLLPNGNGHIATCERMKKQLVVLPDDWFTHFVKHATEINARIALNYDTKTVKDGALFYQEFLPPETVFYAVALMNAARAGKGEPTPLMTSLKDHLPPVLQIGGDETTGKGYCATRLNGGA